ncbi:MAG: agmatine deiminase family protein [Prevotella sp.]|nr:agmatine deiminase family protein [Prevotella sp.]
MNRQGDKEFKESKEFEEFRLPAEWEPQWGVLLTWPHESTDWAPYLQDIINTMTTMAHEIVRRENVLIVAWDENLVPQELREHERVWIASFPTDDTWARDHGPITLMRREERGERKEEVLPCWLDFKFNGWGEKFLAEYDNLVPQKLFATTEFLEWVNYENHEDFVLEGGSIECDGQGTVFTTSQCLLAPHRNQPLSQEEIEEQLKRRLRADKVVWLDHGNLVGDDTDGHIDTIVRVAPDDALIYVGCDDPHDEQYEDFLALEEQLKTLRTTEGKPYRLLRLPMPDAIFEERGEGSEEREERLPATYANFLVINGAVLVPVYGQEENDRRAMEVIQQAFPDREMVPIDSRTIIRQHGSVHCLTMQIPAWNEE